MYQETNIRSITKGLSWCLFATTTTVIIVYIFFGRLDLAIAAGVIETVSNVLLYYAHTKILSVEEAANVIVQYLKKHHIKI